MEDFHLLERITLSGSAEKVKATVKQMGMKPKQYVFVLYSLVIRNKMVGYFSLN